MTPDMEALARRAVACKGWRRMQGMVGRASPKPGGGCATMPPTITIVDPDGAIGALDDGREVLVPDDWLPDLSHPPTLGCLLALVREAQEDRFGAVAYDGRWRWYGKDGEGLPVADDYAVCLVLALEAAP